MERIKRKWVMKWRTNQKSNMDVTEQQKTTSTKLQNTHHSVMITQTPVSNESWWFHIPNNSVFFLHAPSIYWFERWVLVDVRLFMLCFYKMIGSTVGHSCTINTNAHAKCRTTTTTTTTSSTGSRWCQSLGRSPCRGCRQGSLWWKPMHHNW